MILFLLAALVATPASEAALSRPKSKARDSKPAMDVGRLEQRIHTLINQERKKAGLRPLAWDKALQAIARTYSAEMATGGFFSHYDPDGRDFSDRYKKAGYDCATPSGPETVCLGGENLAQNNLCRLIIQQRGRTIYRWRSEGQLAAEVVRQWMASEGHRHNILTGYFRRQGIGVSIAADGKVYITENFC